MIQLIPALVITILAEFIVFWLFVRKGPARLLLYSALINALTLPVATYCYQVLGNFYLIEFAVFLAESALIMLLLELGCKKALVLSLAVNAITAALSFLFML